jgi:hypothetical protein
MAIGTLGTTSETALAALTFNAAGAATNANTLTPADMAALAESIVDDVNFAATNPTGILTTGATHGTTTLDTLSPIAGGLISTIRVGALVLAAPGQIAPGTFVTGILSSNSVSLSQAAIGSSGGIRIGFINPPRIGPGMSFEGRLQIPGGRGIIIVKPGDVWAVDNTGFPILVSAASIAYPGSVWSKA